MIDDIIADETLDKRRQPLLELAISGRHRQHSLWLLTQSYTAVPNNIRRQEKTQVQHGMGHLINMQKSVFLPLWDNYELYGRKILHIESFSAIESENLVRISTFFI